MDIQVRYQTKPLTLANVSLTFIESKPFMRIAIGLFNMIAALFFVIVVLKLILVGSIELPEIGLGLTCLTWVFFRRQLSSKLLHRRMKKQHPTENSVEIGISQNGITWGGQGIKPDSIKWQDLKSIIQTQNGYILPTGVAKFLWVPFDGFMADTQRVEFEKTCDTFNIKRRKIKHSC